MPDTLDYGPAEIAHPEIRLLVAQLDQATAEWLSQIDGDVTPEELAWQPFPGGHSLGALFAHLAEVEQYWLHHIAAGEPFTDLAVEMLGAEIDQMGVRWPTPPAGRPFGFYADRLRATRERTRALLAPMDDPDREIVVTRRRGRGVHTYTLRWVLTHTILHEAYHGGQAALLLLEQRRKA